ncbi:MAG TPA: oxygenase MpaB family protein [Terrimicrobiaceae bacterium]|nr:oxygenase MpaB family protein [Terrimicrobiaceae bacterium]
MVPDALSQKQSIFPPDSAIWRFSREHVLVLGGPAAAILQIAHPEVALGVARHSDFRNDSLSRLIRTLHAVYTITFAPREEVEAIAAHVRRSHAKVQGEVPQRYSAFSLDAQMWVLATLVQLGMESYERFIGPVTRADRESHYRDMRIFGTYFGLPEDFGPQDWRSFSTYYEAMIHGPLLASLPVSAELAHHVAYPRRPSALRALWPVSGAMAREFLPSPVREKLGLPRTAESRLVLASATALIRAVLPALPDRIRFAAQYLRATG